MYPIYYGLADIQRCAGVSWLKDGGSMHPAEERTMWRKGKMIRLRQEKASMFGADRARARVDDTQLRGRQCLHSPRLQSPFPGHREARGGATGLLCYVQPGRGQVQGSRGKPGWCYYWTSEMHTDTRGAREALVMEVRSKQIGVLGNKSCQKQLKNS